MTGYKAYQGKQVEGAGPLGLVLLTYEALYKSLGRAKLSIESKDLAAEAEHSGRAMEALIELSSSLDMDAGGEVAKNLAGLYNYMMNQLLNNVCSGSTATVDEMLQLTGTLRSAWQELQQQEAKQARTAVRRESAGDRMMGYSLAHAA